VSNYPGQVVTRLRRALRYPAAARRDRLTGEVHVSFTVAAGGGVSGISVVRSSGSPVLDQAAIETVQRAAPFPQIPQAAGRSSWPFSVPLAFTR
jgi:periplasmic protein TonB